MAITPKLSDADLARNLDSWIRATTSRGAVQDASLLKRNLLDAVRKFRAMTNLLSSMCQFSGWKMDGYRVDLGFDVARNWARLGTVGCAVILRLDWDAETSVFRLDCDV